VDKTSRQLSIEGTLLNATHPCPHATAQEGPRIILNFLAKGRTDVAKHRAVFELKVATTSEPLRGSDVPGDKRAIHHILGRCEPKRIRLIRRSTWVEDFFVQWEPEKCTLGEALEQ